MGYDSFCGRPCEKLEDRVVNPVGFADSVIVSWITEMRKEKEKYNRSVSVRDMFAGGLSQSTR